ncbi:hypothetical protein I204_07524 [Kwoniella mangroviensis CBS 8886]|nr:hypothetical protein I204_07524 [Kwoniella mangroviensis CBS 8886]
MTTLPTSIPPLPISLITNLLPYLLPPSPLPQEFLSKALLQRLLYLPPFLSDLDSHLSPFPSNDSQPVSTRLSELCHGHQLGDVQYTKEGEEVYARIPILPELDSTTDESVEIWFEYEYGNSESRGWVYHSARLPSGTQHQFVSTPEQLVNLLNEAGQNAMDEVGEVNGDNEAPEGYWTAFDSPTSSPSPHTDILDDQHVEDAYWARYSRPATAPITPGTHTPFHHSKSPPAVDSHEEQAKRLTESLKALGLNGGLEADTQNGYSKVHTEGKRGFWIDEEEKQEENHIEVVQKNQTQIENASQTQTELNVVRQKEETVEESESGNQVKDRLRCKILVSLNNIWKEHIEGSNELDLEIKAMEWLNLGKVAIQDHDHSYLPLLPDSEKGDIIVGKLEILFEMYQVLRENEEKDSFYRLLEGTIRKSPSLGDHQDEFDEVHRQNTYYE